MAYCTRSVRLLMLMIGCLLHALVCGQTDSFSTIDPHPKHQSFFATGLGLQHGFIFAHSEAVENTKGSHPTGVEATLSWQRTDSTIWSLCHCYPRSGLLLAYYDYDNEVLGKSATAAYFLEPTYRLSKRTFFSIKGALGVSYLSHPFDSTKNPSNQSYSTALNIYVEVGVGAWFHINRNWRINPSINYQHISNGGLKEPNKGINWPTAGLTVSYQRAPLPYYTGIRPATRFWKDKPPRFDIALFGIARRDVDANGQSRRMPLVGLAVQGAKQVGRINMLTAGIEASWDKELVVDLEKDTLQGSPVTVGLIAGHEFLLGKMIFSQRLGFYLFDQTPYFDQIYHRWGLTYFINRRLAIGFTLKAHLHVADYMDIRLSYFIQKNQK